MSKRWTRWTSWFKKSDHNQLNKNSNTDEDLKNIDECADDDTAYNHENQNNLLKHFNKHGSNDMDSNYYSDFHAIEYDYKNGTGELYM